MTEIALPAWTRPGADFNSMPAEVKLHIIKEAIPTEVSFHVTDATGDWTLSWGSAWVSGLPCVSKELAAMARPIIAQRLLVKIYESRRLREVDENAASLRVYGSSVPNISNIELPKFPPFVAIETREVHIYQTKTAVMLPFDIFDSSQFTNLEKLTYVLDDIESMMAECSHLVDEAFCNEAFHDISEDGIRNPVSVVRGASVALQRAMCYALQASGLPRKDIRVSPDHKSQAASTISALRKHFNGFLVDPTLGAKFTWFLTRRRFKNSRDLTGRLPDNVEVGVEYREALDQDSHQVIRVDLGDELGQDHVKIDWDGMEYAEAFRHESYFGLRPDISALQFV